jgi:poly(A) polymerase
LNDRKSDRNTAPLIIPRPEHSVSRADISRSALKVLYRLKDGGFQAFLVGGSVRDILLGFHPKDFDVATDASPEQVKSLFGNCRLVGRRFRLAHIRFGREIIEVATFRGDDSDGNGDTELSGSGRIIRDNVYGSIGEDVWRRDFTANALYYNIADFSVWDYAGGVEDIRRKTLRLIGDPERRYREDPVRMLRAMRFAAKLGFSLEPDTAAPIAELGSLLGDVPPARLFDEFQKMFQTGASFRCAELLREHDLFGQLFPVRASWESQHGDSMSEQLLAHALKNTDKRVANGAPVTPAFLFAVLMWGPVRTLAKDISGNDGVSAIVALGQACNRLTLEQNQRLALPRRLSTPMRYFLEMQLRLERTRGKRARSLLDNRAFRAGYDLLLLRAEVGDADPELARFWTDVQKLEGPELDAAFQGNERRGRGRRRGRKRRVAPEAS